MKLSYEFLFIVDSALKKIGYNRNKKYKDPGFKIFEINELNLIENLKLNNCSNIDDIAYLKNLKILKIESIDFDMIKDKYAMEINPYINHIKNFKAIEKLTNLEYLKIENDTNIKEIDLSNLKNLKTIKLLSNPELEIIKGLDSLDKLDNILIYGSNIKNNIDLKKYIDSTFNAKNNILDLSILLNEYKKNSLIFKNVNDLKRKGMTKIDFVEDNGFMNYILIDSRNLEEMLNNLSKKVYKIKKYNDYTKIECIYNYISQEFKFSKKEVIKRQNMYNKFNNNKILKNMRDYFTSLHSSYNLYHFHEGNCEGHVNLMKIILYLVGIESTIVHCRDKRFKDYTGYTNHTMIRVKLNKNWVLL